MLPWFPLQSQAPGTGGQMANVARIYNDNVGVVSAAHSH